jgi:hypothetical protein
MGYSAHKKQALSHQAFMSGDYKRGVLMWGRQCLTAKTLIKTDTGFENISKLKEGDKVLSFGKKWELKKVTGVTKYGVDLDPKPMLHFILYGHRIDCTYDHPFYYNGYYVPIYQLIWGEMEASQREKLQLLCKQYGATFDDPTPRGLQNGGDEASTRRSGLSKDSSGRQNNQDAQISSADMDSKPTGQTRSKPQEQRQNGQSDKKPGVGDTSGEHSTHSQDGQGVESARGELRVTQAQRISGVRDTSYEKHEHAPDGEEVRGFKIHNTRYSGQNELATHIVVTEAEETYSIEVEDNHNYCISMAEILVANSGKTFFSTQHAWISAVLKQGRYFIVFQTYKQAHEVVWRQYVPLIPKELIHKKNEQDLLIELNYIENTPIKLPNGETIMVNHDKTKPRSTIQLLGSDQADTHRGFKGDGIIFDEYATQNPDHWDAVYKHFFTTTNGWAIFMGTPRGYNHFYDLVEFAKEDDRWFYQQATWRDSPYVKKEFIDEERAEATKKGTLSTFLQEVELEFRAVQGAVYPSFNREVHIVKPHDIPDDLTYYGAIDFGWHTTAFLLLGVDKDQNWYVIDEVYGREETLTDVMPRIRDKLADKRISLIIGDSANRDAIEIMGKEYPMMGVNKANDTKGYQMGISLVTEKLKPRIQLTGPPKPTLFFSSVCKNLIREIEAYRFPEDKPERNPSDVPVKEDDHGPDALRYLFLQLKFGLVKDEKPLKFEIERQTNQYGIL